MGIKGFLPRLRKRYPLICKTLAEIPYPQYNCLYVDLPTILITALTAVFSEANQLVEEQLKIACFMLDSLVHLIQPTDLIFISFEGACPYAKEYAVRNRYYTCVQTGSALEHDSVNKLFDQPLKEFISKKIKTDSVWKKPQVLIAPYLMPGEAEMKIFSYIRQKMQEPNYDPNLRHCIYTPDSDLILMSLRSHIPYMDVLYSNHGFDEKRGFKTPTIPITPETLSVISIPLLREYISLDLNSSDERIYDDFATIINILGSDYCPPFDDIENIDLESLIDGYKSEPSCNFISNYDQINYHNMRIFIQKVLKSIAEKKSQTYEQYVNRQKEKFFSNRKLSEEETEKVCHNVLDAITFLYKSYSIGEPSWSWIYQYHFAPPLCLTLEYIDTYKSNFVEDEPITRLYGWVLKFPKMETVLPDFVREFRETNEYFKSLLKPLNEVELDENNGRYKFTIPDLNIVKSLLEPFIPRIEQMPEFSFLIHNQSIIDMKTNQEIMITIDNSRKDIPTFKPFNVSLMMKTVKDHQFVQTAIDIDVLSEKRSDDPSKFIGQRVIGQWPYKTICKVIRIINKNNIHKIDVDKIVTNKAVDPQDDTKQILTDKAVPSRNEQNQINFNEIDHTRSEPKHIDFNKFFDQSKTNESDIHIIIHEDDILVELQPLDVNTDLPCRKPFISIWRLCLDCVQQTKQLTAAFTSNVITTIPRPKWTPVESLLYLVKDIKVDKPRKFILNMILRYAKYDRQNVSLHFNDYNKIVPFYMKKENGKYFVDAANIAPYIQEYLKFVPDLILDESKGKLSESEEKSFNENILDLFETIMSDIPPYASESTESMTKSELNWFESIKEIKYQSKFKIYRGYDMYSNPRVGDTVVIVDNRTVLKPGTACFVVAYDYVKETAWLYVRDNNDLTTFNHTLKTYSGIFVSKTSFVIMN